MQGLLQCPGNIFLAGVLVALTFLLGGVFLADALRKRRIKKSGMPSDPGELKRIVDGLQGENKNLQSQLRKDHERFRNLAAGVNSIGVVILLVAGGVWTFYTFSETRQLEFTQLQREKMELDKAKLQEETQKYFQIQLDLKATQLNFPNAKNAPRYIRVDVSWANPGNWVPKERAHIDFGAGEFKLVRIEGIDRNGEFEFYDYVPAYSRVHFGERKLKFNRGLYNELVGSTMASHLSTSATAIQLVTVPGIYMIWISAKLGDWQPSAVTFIDVK